MKKALVHDWFYTNGGAEKVVHSINNIWFDIEPFSLIDFLNENDRKFILNGKSVKTTFIQNLPTSRSNHRKFLQFFPKAIETLNLKDYDIIISSSSSVAKGVKTNKKQLHICYCHTPMRYAWDLYHEYLKDKKLEKGIKSIYVKWVLKKMRIWDVKSSENVSFFVANSKYVSDRIKKIYNRDSTIIYPPVNIDKFTIQENKEDFYIAASRLVSYKKIALIVKAFNKLPDKKLKVIGSGPQRKYIEKIANKNIEILGYVEDTEIVKKIQSAKALVFAADEDFGILPVEAQACGTPVIAFNKGGVKETVLENKTGLFFDTQTTEDIIKAVEKFENLKFNPIEIRKNAERFSRVRFENEFRAFVELKTKEFYN